MGMHSIDLHRGRCTGSRGGGVGDCSPLDAGKTLSRVRSPCLALSVVAVAALATACATAPTPASPPPPAPQVSPLAEYLRLAQKARSERLSATERDLYREAARHYPAAKEPWGRLAESHFEAADYGQAILAAQEVLQRDAEDQMAASVLAVSGLRVSTQALASLRQHSSDLPADTRTQAEGLTKALRELLGEVVLVPQPVEAAASAAPPAPMPSRRPVVVRTGPRPPTGPRASVAPPATAPARAPVKPTPSVVPTAKSKSPFDTLK